jgi:hypothetical protein
LSQRTVAGTSAQGDVSFTTVSLGGSTGVVSATTVSITIGSATAGAATTVSASCELEDGSSSEELDSKELEEIVELEDCDELDNEDELRLSGAATTESATRVSLGGSSSLEEDISSEEEETTEEEDGEGWTFFTGASSLHPTKEKTTTRKQAISPKECGVFRNLFSSIANNICKKRGPWRRRPQKTQKKRLRRFVLFT